MKRPRGIDSIASMIAPLFRRFAVRLLLVSAMFLVLVAAVITALTTGQYARTLKAQEENTTLAAFSVAAEQIEKVLQSARSAAVVAMQNESTLRFLAGEYTDNVSYILARRDMIAALRETFVRYDALAGLLFYMDDGLVQGATETLTFTDARGSKTIAAWAERVRSEGRMRWIGAKRAPDFLDYAYPETGASKQTLICGIEPISYIFSSGTVAFCAIICSPSKAILDCFAHLSDPDGQVSLLAADGSLIIERSGAEPGAIPAYALEIPPESPRGSAEARINGTPHQLIYTRLPSTGWLLVKHVPLAAYNRPADALLGYAMWISAIVVLAASALYGLWAFGLMRPLDRIAQVLKNLERGGSERMNERAGTWEFALIAGHFNRIMDNTSELHRREINAQHDRLILEIRNLQAQINPHFIYNSIASIRWLAALLGAAKVSDMLAELAAILRPIFSEWRLSWPLREELEFVSHYMNLMRLRYGSDFKAHTEAADDLLEIVIPRFILQPLLENACEHGISPSGGIDVRLDAFAQGEDVILRIEDNGAGMDERQIEQVTLALLEGKPSSARGSGIGLLNVHQRIRLFCGEGYGLTLSRAASGGVRVDARVRAVQENADTRLSI